MSNFTLYMLAQERKNAAMEGYNLTCWPRVAIVKDDRNHPAQGEIRWL